MAGVPEITGYDLYEFYYGEQHYPLYVGGEGPAVVLVHEIPGITPQVVYFADRLKEAGFTVYMPSLFGKPGKAMTPAYLSQSYSKVCISKEFRVLAANETSPITDFLRAVCRTAHAECGGQGVGAIGMCVTGNFALSLLLDESVIAPVLSQPSLPITQTPAGRRGLHMNDSDLKAVKQRMENEDIPLLGLRFTGDVLCAGERFDRLREEFGERFESIEIDSTLGNEHGIHRIAHSVLTNDLVDAEGHPTRTALDRVLNFFDERLKEAS